MNALAGGDAGAGGGGVAGREQGNDDEWRPRYPSDYVELDEKVLKQLRRGDPDVAHVWATFDNRVDWESQGKALSKSKHLKSLRFDARAYDGCDRSRWTNFQHYLAALAGNRSIRHLVVAYSIVEQASSIFLSLLGIFLERNTNLRTFEIWGHRMHSSALKDLADALAKNRTITRLMLPRRQVNTTIISSSTWFALSESLANLSSSLVELNLGHMGIGGQGADAIAESIGMMTNLKSLELADALFLDRRGWRTFFSRMRHFRSLEYLCLDENNLHDGDIAAMVDALGQSSSLKRLSLHGNPDITSHRWQALASILELPNCQLEELVLVSFSAGEPERQAFAGFLEDNLEQIDNDVIIAIANALTHNKSLKVLQAGRFNRNITERGWTALANVLCNNSSIETILASNHTLQRINWSGCSDDRTDGKHIFSRSWEEEDMFYEDRLSDDQQLLVSCLRLNEGANKFEVARQKIILYHFSNGGENIQDIRDLELPLIPSARLG